ncbi:B3 domain-containing protein Os03g0212300-like [Lolium perenne]|nr:B3 domain-containing protein Os03g0212300-like [Lolium perenne]
MAGPGGRRGGRGRGPGRPRGRGRGRRGGAARAPRSPSPASSSSSHEERCFEFLLRIDDDPLGIKRLPDKFAEFVDGVEPAHLQLREASCNFCRWPVEVLFDGQGKMYLHTGWDKFARDLHLEPGCQLTFLYEGDGEMIVKVFDDTACRVHYPHTGESGSDTDS